jgi:hypothetical protein
MLKLLALLIGIAHGQAVSTNPNSYIVFPTLAQAQARSQQQCQQAGCDGKFTIYWWNVVPLNDGTAAVEIQPSGLYAKTTPIPACAVGCGLTAGEQLQLQTATQLGTKLPSTGTLTVSPQP